MFACIVHVHQAHRPDKGTRGLHLTHTTALFDVSRPFFTVIWIVFVFILCVYECVWGGGGWVSKSHIVGQSWHTIALFGAYQLCVCICVTFFNDFLSVSVSLSLSLCLSLSLSSPSPSLRVCVRICAYISCVMCVTRVCVSCMMYHKQSTPWLHTPTRPAACKTARFSSFSLPKKKKYYRCSAPPLELRACGQEQRDTATGEQGGGGGGGGVTLWGRAEIDAQILEDLALYERITRYMYVCVYVCVYICVCVCIYICMICMKYICIIYIYIYTQFTCFTGALLVQKVNYWLGGRRW